MPTTYPNQRTVIINRERAERDFLGIKNENWNRAARELGAHALLLYLYLASNADGFSLALSPAAVRNAVGMAPSTYRDQFQKLIDYNYIVPVGGNKFNFYECPQNADWRESDTARASISPKSIYTDDGFDFENDMPAVDASPKTVCENTAENREININKNTNNIINNNGRREKQVSPTPPEEFRF